MGAPAVKDWISDKNEIDLSRFQLLRDIETDKDDVAKELKKLRAPEQLKSLKDRIIMIAQVLSRNYNIKVLPADDGRWSLAVDPEALKMVEELNSGARATLLDADREKFRPKAILYNLDDIALADEATVMAKMRREATYARETDYRLIFEGLKRARDDGNLASSFGLIQLAYEDARIHEKDIGHSDTAKEKLRQTLAPRYAEVVEKIGQQPLSRQFALNLFYGLWLNGANIPTLSDRRVLDLTEKYSTFLEEYMLSPSNEASYKVLREKLWPDLKALEEGSIQDESVRLLAEEIVSTYVEEQRHENTFFVRIARGWQKMWRIKPAPPKRDPDTAAVQALVDQNGGDMLRQQLRDTLAAQQASRSAANDRLRDQKADIGYMSDKLDLSLIPESMRNALDAILANIPVTVASSYRERARGEVERIQAEAMRRELPVGIELEDPSKTQSEKRSNFSEPPPAEEINDRSQALESIADELGVELEHREPLAPPVTTPEQDEEEAKARAQATRAELVRRELVRQGFTPEERQHYENFKALENSVIGRLPAFLEDLRPHLPKKRAWKHGTELFYTGSRLDSSKLAKRVPIKDYRLYRRREPVDSPDPRMFVTLLIDSSPSMLEGDGSKLREALKTAIFWGRALREMDVPFSIKIFGGDVKDIKSFGQDYDDASQRIKPDLIKELNGQIPGTNIEKPLRAAYSEMQQVQRRLRDSFGAIFIISDSGANQGMTADALRNYIAQIQREYPVINFILTHNKAEVRESRAYFGERNVVAPESFGALPAESIRVLRSVLREAFKIGGGVRS